MRNISKQKKTGQKIIADAVHADLTWAEIQELLKIYESNPGRSKVVDVIIASFMVGVAAGNRIAKREQKREENELISAMVNALVE